MVKSLTVYKASAGSGKTFTLTTEYIRLLVENPQSYHTILAVTFTNKATEEMKTRILSQLYGIWKVLPTSEAYLEVIQEKTGLTANVISQRAGIALQNLLHNYSYFRVETIDTFFQSVLRNMARELDLTTNLRIGLNDVQVEEMAVDQLIQDLSVGDIVLQWLMRYILENISDDKSWNVIGQIKQFGRNIFRDEYKAVSTAIDQQMATPQFFENYSQQLRDIRQQAADRMKALADRFFETIEAEGLTIDDFSYGKSGVCGFFLKLRDGMMDEGIVGKRIADSVGDASKWYKKSHPRRELIHALADGPLDGILRQALDTRPQQWRLYKSADLTLQHLNQVRLLSSIEQKVRCLNEEANRFLLSDTQQLLHSLIDGSDSPFIFEKIGTQLEHVMIDEFQDTSTVQWQNFRVLLLEAMSHESEGNLIVGDVKQSIYRWRSGDWRLLNNIEQQFSPGQIDVRSLQTNYRSQRRIITFNNAFFRQATEIEYLEQQELNEVEAQQLRRAYADVEQAVPDSRPDEGYVSILLLPDEDYQQQVLSQLAESVTTLTTHNVAQRDIAILVRTNALIPIIAQYFNEQMPDIRIISDEAFRLDASMAVRLIIDALRLLTHPDDQLTKASLVKTWQHDILNQLTPDEELLLSNSPLDDQLPEAFTTHFDELLTLSLYELVEQLFTIFQLDSVEGQSAYLCAFYDHLTDFVGENATDIESFLHEWEDALCAKTIQSVESDGIRLISIHKSKGLEFGHVIIPFCDWQLEKSGNVLWCRPSEPPFDALPIVPVDYSRKQMMGTIYEKDYCQEHLQTTVDNLNLLYVAFTRACHSLFVIGHRNASGSRSAVVEQAIPRVAQQLPDATVDGLDDETQPLSFTFGSLSAVPEHPHSPHSSADFSSNPFLQSPTPVTVAIRSFDSKVSFRQSNRSRDFITSDAPEALQQKEYIQTGSVLHQLFSTIRTTDDIPHALHDLQSEGILYDEHISAASLTAMIRKRLQDPRVAEWFSPHWTLFNECTILTVEEGRVKERRPDRVMTDGRHWVVVDFKFGQPRPEYHDQVREYMQLIATMHPEAKVSGYLWFVYSNKIEEVR